LPGFLSAQERWLRGIVATRGAHEEKLPAVHRTVTRLQQGEADTTKARGLLCLVRKEMCKPGERVTLVLETPDWHIRAPLDGQARIPAHLAKAFVAVPLVPVGSKLCWTPERIATFLRDGAENATPQVPPADQPAMLDCSRDIQDWAAHDGFRAQQAQA
jgi:hypothetical protein